MYRDVKVCTQTTITTVVLHFFFFLMFHDPLFNVNKKKYWNK